MQETSTVQDKWKWYFGLAYLETSLMLYEDLSTNEVCTDECVESHTNGRKGYYKNSCWERASPIIVWVIYLPRIFRFHIELEKKRAPWKCLPMVIPLYVYTRESSLDKIPAHRNLTGRCTTALSPMLSSSSSLPPTASHFAFIPAQLQLGAYKDLTISVLYICMCMCVCIYIYIYIYIYYFYF